MLIYLQVNASLAGDEARSRSSKPTPAKTGVILEHIHCNNQTATPGRFLFPCISTCFTAIKMSLVYT
jgi:hypothetical protein